ncbi:hypothetical protein A0H81_08341 [Grifola frondosa]|uniref:Zinc knuckle-domain-containing protein n=1 Tax=Grifola frondosa TaxID=5627 RepID=A0A1C7M3Z0_GRIFR|nr:hypothetical protein A0H81_08341 [Grifola frondosa]
MSKFAPHRKSASQPRATSSTICQKCLGTGHFIYECKSTRPYVSRPSRTQQLENPRVLAKLKTEGKPSVEVPEEFKTKSGTANRILTAKEKERAKKTASEDEVSGRRESASGALVYYLVHAMSSRRPFNTSDTARRPRIRPRPLNQTRNRAATQAQAQAPIPALRIPTLTLTRILIRALEEVTAAVLVAEEMGIAAEAEAAAVAEAVAPAGQGGGIPEHSVAGVLFVVPFLFP